MPPSKPSSPEALPPGATAASARKPLKEQSAADQAVSLELGRRIKALREIGRAHV